MSNLEPIDELGGTLNLKSKQSVDRRPSMFIAVPLEQIHQLRAVAGTSTCTFSDDPSCEVVVPKKFPVKYQNTYKLTPDEHVSTAKVEALVEQVLFDYLDEVEYTETFGRKMVKVLTDKILAAVKKLNSKRYKFVALVNLGQFHQNTVRVASRCLWHTQHDTFAEVIYEGKSFWVTAVLYAVYQE